MSQSISDTSAANLSIDDELIGIFYKTIGLCRERYAAQYGMRLENIDALATIERATNKLFVQLYHDVYCAKKTKSISITVPDTWIDAFKLRWYPTLGIKLYPAKMRTVTESVDAIALFPELQSSRNEHRIEFIIADNDGY